MFSVLVLLWVFLIPCKHCLFFGRCRGSTRTEGPQWATGTRIILWQKCFMIAALFCLLILTPLWNTRLLIWLAANFTPNIRYVDLVCNQGNVYKQTLWCVECVVHNFMNGIIIMIDWFSYICMSSTVLTFIVCNLIAKCVPLFCADSCVGGGGSMSGSSLNMADVAWVHHGLHAYKYGNYNLVVLAIQVPVPRCGVFYKACTVYDCNMGFSDGSGLFNYNFKSLKGWC